jgi:RHS repeat-associated protein
LIADAGGPWHAELDDGTWVYTAHYGESYEPPTTFGYDADIRLTNITPPAGDATVIDYDDTNRKVTVTQGTASSIENYDHRGRLTKRETTISSGIVSKQTFEYDSLNNLTKQSEKTLDPSPSTFINKTYDALNRVTSITTADGLTTYTYNGPDVTITVQSELGNLVTTMKYDAAGRLIKVVEPNAKATTYAYDASDRLIRVCHDDNDDICAAGHSFRRDFVYSTRGKLLSETHPESGTTTYKYDKQGRMIEKKFAGKSSPIQYTYDPRGRILTINYPNDPDVAFYYDGDVSSRPIPGYETEYYEYPRGHLTGMVDATGVTIWKYFNVNRQLTRKDLHLSGITDPIILEYAYDTRNNLQSITYPSGQIVKNYRNDANAINQITRKFGAGSETNLLNSATYNSALLPSSLNYGNGVILDISSDLRNRPDVMNSAGKLTLDYRYNVRGLIDQIGTGQNGGPTQLRNIAYDNLGRITTFNSDVATLTYNYDIFGNLTSKTGPVTAGPFTYTNNRINGVSYSASGNQLLVNGKTLVYNQENRAVQVTDGSTNTFYTYDGQGNRVKSFDALTGMNRYFIYDEAGGLLAELSQRTAHPLYIDKEYVQGPTGTIAVANHDETPRGLKLYDLNGKIHLEWVPNPNCPIAGYNVYRSNTQNGTYTLLNTGGPITTAYYDDANVTECTTYWYQIKTVYTGGAVGPASSKIAHQFKHLRAVFYNSPSPGTAPLVETFTYNKAGGCPSVNASNYNIDFGDGFVQNFTTPGTVNRTYTTGSSCYPFCVANLTVTFTNGVVATQSRLVNMSTNLVADENFNDNVADGFTVQSGTWSAASQIYTGSSTGTAWGISTSSSSCNNCVIAAQANTANQTNKNAYIIFGYIDSKNFQYAGYEISPNRWVIGEVINNSNFLRASFTQTLGTGVWHSMELKLEASSKTVTLKGNGVTRCMYTFTNLYSLPIGFAVKGAAQSSFDNFKIAPAYTVTTLHTENFNDGVANGYTPVTGTWSIVSSRYRGTIATATDAVSLTPLATFNSGVIAADIRVVTNNGWVLFDYVNATNFKFAGIDDAANLWVIGEVVNGTKFNRATFAQTLNPNTSYPSKILLEGSTVTIVNSNTIKTRFAFTSLTARPVGFGLRGNATSEFDNVSIYTETMPSGTVGNPPAVPVPTSTAGAADVATESYDSPAFYYNLNDHLGSARITMNQSGAVTSSVEYFPFGELKSATGCAASSQRFTGKLFDNESGLQYFGARYLSNDLTRFVSTDPARESVSMLNPQSWNRYTYSLNNPLSYIDPDGRVVVLAGTKEQRAAALATVAQSFHDDAAASRLSVGNDGKLAFNSEGTKVIILQLATLSMP